MGCGGSTTPKRYAAAAEPLNSCVSEEANQPAHGREVELPPAIEQTVSGHSEQETTSTSCSAPETVLAQPTSQKPAVPQLLIIPLAADSSKDSTCAKTSSPNSPATPLRETPVPPRLEPPVSPLHRQVSPWSEQNEPDGASTCAPSSAVQEKAQAHDSPAGTHEENADAVERIVAEVVEGIEQAEEASAKSVLAAESGTVKRSARPQISIEVEKTKPAALSSSPTLLSSSPRSPKSPSMTWPAPPQEEPPMSPVDSSNVWTDEAGDAATKPARRSARDLPGATSESQPNEHQKSAPEAGLVSDADAVVRLDRQVSGFERQVSTGLQASNFITQKKKNVNVLYNIEGTPIGRGGFGIVYIATEKATSRKVAIKFLSLARCGDIQTLLDEIELTKQLDHPYIVKIFASFQDRTNLYIVMELCPGGELFKRITEAKGRKIPENLAVKVMNQMLRAVNYMHVKEIVHRDLKPENFLLATKEPLETNTIKLIDFGLSKHVQQDEQLTAMVGSASYVAPEVIAGSYNKSSDLWSCGVMLYLMLAGQPPFTGTSDKAVLQKVQKGEYRLSGRLWEPFTTEVKDLISGLMELDPNKRLTAEQALETTWFQSAPAEADSTQAKDLVSNLRDFSLASRFKKAAMLAVAHTLRQDEVVTLKRAFTAFDIDGNGSLSLDEMSIVLEAMADLPESTDVAHLMENIDMNGDGSLSYTEFLAAAMDQKIQDNRDLCWRAFKTFDLDDADAISLPHMQKIFDEAPSIVKGGSPTAVEELFREIDANSDGKISFEEFRRALQNGV